MKQNKKAATLIGCLLTICTMAAAILIGWNHMNEITQGPKSKEEIGYYQWDRKQMDTFSDLTTFTYQGEKYETSDGGGDGAMNFGFYEVSKKDYKTAFWLKDTMNKQDKKIAKIIPWWKEQAEPVYTISSKSGCKMVFIDPDNDMMQIVFWKVKDRIKITKYYTDFNNYDFTLTDSKTNEKKKISAKEAMKYAKLQQIRKDAKNVKEKYNISGDSKDKVAYVDFDIMTVGGKEYVGKEEEW